MIFWPIILLRCEREADEADTAERGAVLARSTGSVVARRDAGSLAAMHRPAANSPYVSSLVTTSDGE